MNLYPDIYHDFVLSGPEVMEFMRTERPNVSQDEAIALTILDDLLGRRGYRQEFDGFDEGVQNEVLENWIGIIQTTPVPFVMARNILSDVRSRSGWEDIYDSIDEDITEDMLSTWEKKITDIQSAS